MLTLLSPAKNLNLDPVTPKVEPSTPQLSEHTKLLAKRAKQLSVEDLQSLMKLSDNLATLNYERFQAFTINGRSNSAKPAIYTFNGNVYEGFDAASIDADSLNYAQDHLRILSGLYGVLRPMDLVQPYRLEMGKKLDNPRGKNLYQFWNSHIADSLMQTLSDHSDKTILNLASNEYFKAVDKKALDATIITPKFLNLKDGQARNLMYYAKRARGLMARWAMDEKIENASDLTNFNVENYQWDKALSYGSELVFTRHQPAPKK